MDPRAPGGTDGFMDHERLKYERMHRIPGYSPGPGRSHIPRFLSLLEGRPSVIDYGCGTGDAALVLHELGFEVYLVDIAHNSIRPATKEILGDRFFVSALHELPGALPAAEWGFCCDVLEHLPTDYVERSLRAMRARTPNLYCSISGSPDGWGRHINEVLHLTVKPREWWEREIGKHWKTVESLGGSNKVFEIVGRG